MTRTGRPVASSPRTSGRVECTVFPDTLEARALLTETIVVASGRVEVRGPRQAAAGECVGRRGAADRRRLHIEMGRGVRERLVGIDGVLAAPGRRRCTFIVRPDHSRLALRSRRFRGRERPRDRRPKRHPTPGAVGAGL